MGKQPEWEKLQEILQDFGPEAIGAVVRNITEGAHLRKSYKDFEDPGPEVDIGTDSRVAIADISNMERIINPDNNLLPVHFLEEGGLVQKAVARVTLTDPYGGLPAGSGWGTGFMVSPSLFLTNNHVIPDVAFARKVEMQFNFQFDYKGNPLTVDTFAPDPDDLFYTNVGLDFTLVRLDPHCQSTFQPVGAFTGGAFREAVVGRGPAPAGIMPQGIAGAPSSPSTPMPPDFAGQSEWGWPWSGRPWLPRICWHAGNSWGHLQLSDTMTFATDQHINIIQHPQGRRKEVALQQNRLTNVYPERVRYTTDTEPGSSGSPVFNNEWDLIAIHHAAGDYDPINSVWLSNEGMRIDKIVGDLRSQFSGTTTGTAVLTELGI
ncbi:MAG: trypsin-like serine peptidase [Candidatus Methylomirabilales bacterium]